LTNLDNPPPGTYNPSDVDSMSGLGTYLLSNFKSPGKMRIKPLLKALSPDKGAHEGLFSNTRNSKQILT
jgi:hypothetical protein